MTAKGKGKTIKRDSNIMIVNSKLNLHGKIVFP